MKRSIVILALLVTIGFVFASCRSRQPHCPGVYSNTHITKTLEKV